MTAGNVPRLTATPPDRGSFPLDHEGLCKDIADHYVKCIGDLKGNALECRHLAAQYMQCRIDNKLLNEEPLTNFGFRERDINPEKRNPAQTPVTGDNLVRTRQEKKESKGFIAGEGVVKNYARDESLLSKLLSSFLK